MSHHELTGKLFSESGYVASHKADEIITAWLREKAQVIGFNLNPGKSSYSENAREAERILGLESPAPDRSVDANKTKGTEMERYWCDHLTEKFSHSAQRKRWFLKQPSMPHAECIADDFKLCPVCAAPRPAMEKKEGNKTIYSREKGDREVTCWHCKETFLCDPMDACCRMCDAPYDKTRCKEFGFTPSRFTELWEVLFKEYWNQWPNSKEPGAAKEKGWENIAQAAISWFRELVQNIPTDRKLEDVKNFTGNVVLKQASVFRDELLATLDREAGGGK